MKFALALRNCIIVNIWTMDMTPTRRDCITYTVPYIAMG
jgi:hypothetical protein